MWIGLYKKVLMMELCESNGIIGINKSSIKDGAINICKSDFVFVCLDLIFSRK